MAVTDSEETTSNTRVETDGPPSTGDDGHDHAHSSEGPHGGSLIELGNEEYHAELVHDEQAGTITIYVLDRRQRQVCRSKPQTVSINLTHEGRGEQFKLTAAADQNDPQGKSSRFVSSDADLAKEFDHEHAEAQLAAHHQW